MDVGLGSNLAMTVLDVMFSFVIDIDLADNFDDFLTLNYSFFKSSWTDACEVVVTTKNRIHCWRTLYYVTTQYIV